MFDLIWEDVVTESTRGSWEAFIPVDGQINQMSLVDGDHPVVREVLVYYFSHLGHLFVEDLRDKAKENEEYRSLLGECDRPVFSVRVGWQLVVDVVIFNCVDK